MPLPLQLTYPVPPSAAVLRNPSVSTEILQVTTTRMDQASPEYYDFAGEYEAGRLITFRTTDYNLSPTDWDLLNLCGRGATDELAVKKAKYVQLIAPVLDDAPHPLDQFTRNRRETHALRSLVAHTTERLVSQAMRLFPTYRFVSRNISWRLTPTTDENLHYDSYGVRVDDLHYVRLFVNLDTGPRVWAIGPPLTETIANYSNRIRKHADQHPNVLTDTLDRVLPWGEIPRHHVTFAPCNLWLVNSQLIAHQVLYGRKMLAITLGVDPASMKNQDNHFVARTVSSLRKAGLCPSDTASSAPSTITS